MDLGRGRLEMSTAERLRKIATGLCLVIGPLGLLIGLVLHPAESMDAAEQLGIIASDADRWAMAHFIITGSAIVLGGAVLGLAHLLHEHRPAQAVVGGARGVVGAMSLCAVAFSEATYGAQMGRVGTTGGVLDAYSAVAAQPASLFVLIGALMGPLGSIVLGSGLYMASVVPRWTAIALMLGGVCLVVGLPLGLMQLAIVGAALQLLALAPIGFMVFSESDEEWMHTPARAAA
jgi:hypothetical protein